MVRDRLISLSTYAASDHLLAFSGLTVSFTALPFLSLFQEESLVFKTTWWPNECNMLDLTMLDDVVSACWISLAGSLAISATPISFTSVKGKHCIIVDFFLFYLTDQVLVGALNAKDAKPLTPDLERVVSGSGEHGFIIVSFGSNVASILPRAEVDVLARAFGNLKQRVLWRLKGNI